MDMWRVLQTFDSEGEARVIESFLIAHGIDAHLLGTHDKSKHLAPGSLMGAGMRLMVRMEQVEAARKLLSEQARKTHLEVVGEEHVPHRPARFTIEKIFAIALLIVLIAAAIYFSV